MRSKMMIPARTHPETSSECHPERSEGSLSFRFSPGTAEILRFAQNDIIQERGCRMGSNNSAFRTPQSELRT